MLLAQVTQVKIKLLYVRKQGEAIEIADIIKMIVKCFNPSIDTEHLKLPQRAYANYMRRGDLKTVSNGHKATVLCEHAAGDKGFRMNTDGTTLAQ